MKLHYDADTEAFRAELRAWIDANQPTLEEIREDPQTSSAHLTDWARRWQRRLFDAGLLVPGWPPALGGRNLGSVQQLVYFEEMAKLRFHRAANPQGLSIIAPSLHYHASDFLKARYLLPTLRAEIAWCLGMSEPGAGSDFAGLSTRAEVHDDRFVVRGQKIWTSGAHHADHCFCFVRTDPDAPRHAGISVVIIDMKSPRVTVRPLPEMSDRSHVDFNEVFFDGVEVPRDHLVGELNQGWSISMGSLVHERGMMWVDSAANVESQLEAIRELARQPGPDGRRIGESEAFRDELARIFVDTQALWFMGYRGFAKFARGEVSPEHSVLKLFSSEISQRVTQLAAEFQGTRALDVEHEGGIYDESFGRLPWMTQYFQTFRGTIAGGTSEIQRNIIAQRVLGLPRA